MDLSSMPVVGKAVVGLGLVNIALTAVKQILDKVAAGSSADTLIGKACAVISKLLSFVTANTQAAPAAAAAVTDQAAAPAPAAQPAQAPQA